jgi:phosphatidylethanolamine-binding protein (PEBP) family uncharacterized protein
MKYSSFIISLLIALNINGQDIDITPIQGLNEFTCNKKAVSPPIHWKHSLKNVTSYIVIIESKDIDGQKLNMISYNIPGKQFRIPGALKENQSFGGRVKFGINTIGKPHYFPICKRTANEIIAVSIKILALEKLLPQKDGLSMEEVMDLAKGSIIAEGIYTTEL